MAQLAFRNTQLSVASCADDTGDTDTNERERQVLKLVTNLSSTEIQMRVNVLTANLILIQFSLT